MGALPWVALFGHLSLDRERKVHNVERKTALGAHWQANAPPPYDWGFYYPVGAAIGRPHFRSRFDG